MDNKYVLGIDTSNYKTSIAVIDQNYNVIYDAREFLRVKRGERGLRQSEALFQHVQTIPELIERIPVDLCNNLSAVAWSSRPRPIDGSYMPVFNAGISQGRSIASVSGVLGIGFSHQEGHIEAIRHDISLNANEPFIACHFSGGTSEINIVKPRRREVVLNSGVFYKISNIGGSKDIAYGQVLDRAGVAMGIGFPAGEEMDKLAISACEATNMLTSIKVGNASFNLSGIDTQIKNIIDDELVKLKPEEFICEIFTKLADSIIKSVSQACEMTGINKVIMAGGVTSSAYIRDYIKKSNAIKGCNLFFGKPELSQDNAVGIAILGGRYVWD